MIVPFYSYRAEVIRQRKYPSVAHLILTACHLLAPLRTPNSPLVLAIVELATVGRPYHSAPHPLPLALNWRQSSVKRVIFTALAALFTLSTANMRAANPKPTEIRGHCIGESIATFLRIEPEAQHAADV